MSAKVLTTYQIDSSSPEARAQRVKYVRAHLMGLSRPELADENSELNLHALKAWEMAVGGGLSEKGAIKLVERLKKFNVKCSPYWLLHGIGLSPTLGVRSVDISEADEAQIAKELLIFREQPNSRDTVIEDDTMTPFLFPGNYVAGLKLPDTHLHLGMNKICIVLTENNLVYVRSLRAAETKGLYDLVALNSDCVMSRPVIKNEKLLEVTPVLWIRKKPLDLL